MDEPTVVHSGNTNSIGGGGKAKIVLTSFVYQPLCCLFLSHDTAPGKKHEAKTAELYLFTHLPFTMTSGDFLVPHGSLLAELEQA